MGRVSKRFVWSWLVSLFAFACVLCLVKGLGWWVVYKFPENHNWQFEQHMKSGNYEEATLVARRQVGREHYDFQAHRNLARGLLKLDRAKEATDCLLMSLDRMSAAHDRPVYNRGYDELDTHLLLAESLRMEGRKEFADEVSRMVEDLRVGSEPFQSGREISDIDLEDYALTDLQLSDALLTNGVTLSATGTLNFASYSVAEWPLEKLTPPVNGFVFTVSGDKIMGFGGILKVSIGDVELIRIYANSPEPREVSVSVPAGVLGENFKRLQVSFINDIFEPVSGADRNLRLHRVAIY